MVRYGHSVEEMCLKNSHLLMREKKIYFKKYFSWNVIYNFPTPEASFLLPSLEKLQKIWSLKKPNCICMSDASFVKPSTSCELSPLGLLCIIFYKTDKEDSLLQKMYSLGPNTKKHYL